uniref:Uncharacterized protein n=1 Tax=Gloeothece verrucosa (strain PCC 7822) TaxID=497965 RepID=E0U6B4_GLOV7|nr:hypothetical protein Cyan7822_0405 [Gloeothece verrucosa PCC 7822]
MEHPTEVKHDDTIIGFILGLMALLCLFTFIVLVGIF